MFPLLIKDILKKESLISLINQVIHAHFFSNIVYQTIKSNSRPKFLNIGLKLTCLILTSITSEKADLILSAILKPDFLRIFVKNYQN